MEFPATNSDEDVAFLLILKHRRNKRQRNMRRYWVHPLNLLRPTMGEHLKLEEMYSKYPDRFFEYTRLSPSQFDVLLEKVECSLLHQDTNYRLAIEPRIRLFVTLLYLATGDSMRSIATSFSMGVTTVWRITAQSLKIIWEKMSPIYVKPPNKDEWQKIIANFEETWNFPNCLGAIDGKHCVMQAPANSGSAFHNYKGTFSVVLMATCDAKNKFTTIDVGAYGRQSDGGIFAHSALGKSLYAGTLDIPPERCLPNSTIVQQCTFLGDEAFPLTPFLMRPYPGKFLPYRKRIYNYRQSRARRVIENAFGIMCSRFRIFRRPILASPEQVSNIVKATVALHNYLRTEEATIVPSSRRYCPIGYVDVGDELNGGWRSAGTSEALQEVPRSSSNMYGRVAKEMRDKLADYFVAEGKVSWQDEQAGISAE